VTPENSGLRFARIVTNHALGAVFGSQNVGMLRVRFAERTHAVIAQEFIGMQHAPKQTFHSMTAREGNQTAIACARFVPARDETGEVRPVLEIPLEAFLK